MRNWKIVPQIEYENFKPYFVWCKEILHFPVEDAATGTTSFGRLPRNLSIFQVIVEADGDQHRLKVIRHKGRAKYVWQHPDRMEHPTFNIGLPKSGNRHVDSRRQIVDTLAPKRRVPGYKAAFTNKAEFVEHLNRVLGNELAGEVLGRFRMRIREL